MNNSNKVNLEVDNTKDLEEIIKSIINRSVDRFTICIQLINELNLTKVAELGVFRGLFAQKLLGGSKCIDSYTMIDPWRKLDQWNKPSNNDDKTFENFYREALQVTDFAKEKRIVLRGKTSEIINQVENHALDFVYIDGDHTLKGISIDLINIWPKVKDGGFVVGDDFLPSIWHHNKKFEPTMVFPFAVYFAEAVDAKIYALPYSQFIIYKKEGSKFEFIDLTNGVYNDTSLKDQFFKRKNKIYDFCIKIMNKLKV